ncbi:MAG: ferritin [Bacteroidota bacterium]
MIKPRVEEAINQQIQAEVYSSYLYMSMSAYANGTGFAGAAQWLKVQAQEELTHALRLYHFLQQRGGKVTLLAIDQPPSEFGTLSELFGKVLAHEEHVTSLINRLMDVALEERDHAASQMLQWFVNEQVEEEANVNDLVNRLKLVGNEGNALFMLDKELATRVFVPHADLVI